jgi:hypothetical protein
MKVWLSKFIRGLEDVDRALRHPPSAPPPDPALHDSIMRAVRAAARAEQPQRKPIFAWVVSAGVALSLAALAAGLLLRPAATPKSVMAPNDLAEAPGAALDLGERMPGMFMAPLSNELVRVDHDLHNTTQVLLASFP